MRVHVRVCARVYACVKRLCFKNINNYFEGLISILN